MARKHWLWLAAGAAATLGLGTTGVAIMTSDRMKGPRWDNLLPEAKGKALRLIEAAKRGGLDVMFWEGWRDPAQEAADIARGTSHLKDPFNSLHTWGAAFDLVFRSALGMPSWPPISDKRWRYLADLGNQLGLRSGLLMWGWDAPHFQIASVNVAQLRRRFGNDYLAFIQGEGQSIA